MTKAEELYETMRKIWGDCEPKERLRDLDEDARITAKHFGFYRTGGGQQDGMPFEVYRHTDDKSGVLIGLNGAEIRLAKLPYRPRKAA